MKTIVTLLLLATISMGSTAQDKAKIDSLVNTLKTSKDTTRVKTLVDLATRLKFNEPQKALDFANESLEASKSSGYKMGIAESNNIIGIIYGIQNNYPKSLDYLLRALKIYEEIGFRKGESNAINNVANIYSLQKDGDNAIKYYKKALEIKSSFPDKKHEVSGLNSLGLAYTDFEQYEKAEECFNQIIKLGEDNERSDWSAKAYNQLGRNANLKGDYEKALRNYKQAVRLNRILERKQSEAIATSNIGEVYKNMNNYPKAIDFYKKSLVLREEIGYKYGMAITTLKIAQVYQVLSNYDESVQYANTSLEIAKTLGIKEFVRDALETLSIAYLNQQNYKKAYEYQLLFKVAQDSVLNEKKIKQLSKMQARFDLKKKEQQIAAQLAEIAILEQKEMADRNLRYALFFAAGFVLFLTTFIYSRYKTKQKTEKVLQSKNEELKDKNDEIKVVNGELEKRMLRLQMNPHFIFNSLNSIQHFITINNKESALKYLSKFSKLIRQVLENSVSYQVPIADEIKLLEYYIELESLRFDHKFDHSIEIDETLDVHYHEIPFLLIQPYVENSITHGLIHQVKRGKLKIELQNKSEYILCIVEDNGIGRKKAMELKNKKSNSYTSQSMSITAERLKLLNGGKKRKTLVSVIDLSDENHNSLGTKVEIQIPIDLN